MVQPRRGLPFLFNRCRICSSNPTKAANVWRPCGIGDQQLRSRECADKNSYAVTREVTAEDPNTSLTYITFVWKLFSDTGISIVRRDKLARLPVLSSMIQLFSASLPSVTFNCYFCLTFPSKDLDIPNPFAGTGQALQHTFKDWLRPLTAKTRQREESYISHKYRMDPCHRPSPRISMLTLIVAKHCITPT